ncbi:MAG: signal recognition particle protein [Bacteroidetes bacterium]|nr:signal recognition particle protein [Rhodothermia bacterium]MCS7155837.1 signal recognition particle protein [Bacteroidota bacterium]MCX7906062.1 signal recognition particle protein [Bacteroidota bacterium]MDW8138190.1 signal recognition particle protein [Bacteroidota bacterium]MDW8285874.1 signal recognition particle protein [Bacteroidota bacterium]
MFEELSQKLEAALKTLRGEGRITELNIAEAMRQVRRALLEADVHYQVARDFTERVKERALGQRVYAQVSPGQQFIKIVYDELVALLGGQREELRFSAHPPTVILIVGLQGSGKTTFSAKLAAYLKRKGRAPLLVAADVHRPAAIEQLRALGAQIQVPVFSLAGAEAVRVAEEGVREARRAARDVVILDTAGRLHIDEAMMQEVAAIKRAVRPQETLFVVDSMTGQDAVRVAKAFQERLDFDGVVLTKLDGDARGGAALSIRYVVQKPIKFASTGERLDQLMPFHPDRMAQRILGFGDVLSLVERAQEQYDREQAALLERKLRKAEFTLEDFYAQLGQIRKMGSLRELLSMIPGAQKALPKDWDLDERALRRIEAMICSMTPEERRHPEILNASRRRRIAQGSGVELREVNQFLRQFEELRRWMKTWQKLGKQGRTLRGFPFFR